MRPSDPLRSQASSGSDASPPDGDSAPTAAAAPQAHGVEVGSQAADASQESPWTFWRSVLITLAVALGIRQYLLEARYIPSGSMLPGLQIQDRLLVEKLSYRFRAPRRGEIVVFNSPFGWDPVMKVDHNRGFLRCLPTSLPLISQIPGVQEQACDAFIKRVVAVAGDQVSINPRGEVIVNGRRLHEPYVSSYCRVDAFANGCPPLNAVVPPGHVLTLGDNRPNSMDGRYWPSHFLPRSEIIGRAFWRFLPLRSWGPLGPTNPPSP